ncbi:hypothetical protein EMM73_01310 [Rheinheimera sediminis]|uniref:hypothetical protein n=1 Tax=Rheinheimera sp. YQF-1 TaxID=2499626 RepID=UPI000FD7CADB|nr:hypothetical protein [Rheinheimera sp. YQF-1]RVT48610.1 hypothetical protein EMM73_01310 [Rheinheimera sp. YQF-1]
MIAPLYMNLNIETVPNRYQKSSVASSNDYDVIKLTKFEPDEKDISSLYIRLNKPSRDVRAGWLIPAISLISIDHDFSDNPHFINYAGHIFNKFKDQTLDERTYFFIWYRDNLKNNDIDAYDYVLDLSKHGIYPLESEHSKYKNNLSLRVPPELTLKKRFNYRHFKGFVKDLYSNILQDEINLYARFMHIYQVMELSMDLALQAKMMEFKDTRKHLGIIREKLPDYFKESKLINAVYEFNDGNKDITNIILAANSKLHPSTGRNYNSAEKHVAIYDFRNMLVHNYYRFKDDIDISLFCDHLEFDILEILTKIIEADYYKEELKLRYLN